MYSSVLSQKNDITTCNPSNMVAEKCYITKKMFSISHSLTHPLTHALTHSLTHSLTHAPTHSLTHLLSYSWNLL